MRTARSSWGRKAKRNKEWGGLKKEDDSHKGPRQGSRAIEWNISHTHGGIDQKKRASHSGTTNGRRKEKQKQQQRGGGKEEGGQAASCSSSLLWDRAANQKHADAKDHRRPLKTAPDDSKVHSNSPSRGRVHNHTTDEIEGPAIKN